MVDNRLLNKEQIAFYRDKGYIAVENVLSADEIGRLRTVTDRLVEQSRAVTAGTYLETSRSCRSTLVRWIRGFESAASSSLVRDAGA